MPDTSSAWSRLIGWGAAGSVLADERAHLQRRVALFFATGFVFLFGYWAYYAGRCVVDGDYARIVQPLHLGHAGLAIAIGGAALYVRRRGERPAVALHFLEGAGTILICAGYATMAHYADPAERDKIALGWAMGTFLTLVLRAAVVPSSATRTAAVSAVSVGLIWLAIWDPSRPSPGPEAVWPPRFVATYGVGFVLLSAIVSRVIYGLSNEVRRALRLGQYELVEKIGEGGMGAVYRARHALLRRPTAVKLLPPARAGAEAIARFEREVQQTSRLTHPNTVAIYDFGRTPDGVFYYAMEYLDGIDLQDLVVELGPLRPERVAHLLAQAAGALCEAHDLGLVHRDVKPSNLVVCRRGGAADTLKVVDFGLVKDVERAEVGVTSEGALTGTPLYMAPEVIRGAENASAASDLYALGAVGYFLLVGAPPFEGGSPVEVCAHHLHTAPEPPSSRRDGVPAELEALVLSCLDKDPSRRPGGARALREALRPLGASWTEERADAWWAAHVDALPAARERRSATAPAPPGGVLTVALARRRHEEHADTLRAGS